MKKILIVFAAMVSLLVSCSKENESGNDTAKPLAEQILGDWRMDQCNIEVTSGGPLQPAYEVGSLWKFYKGEDSPVGTIWMNGVKRFYYTLTGNLLHTSSVESMDAGSYYTVEINNESTMNLYRRDDSSLALVLSKIQL